MIGDQQYTEALDVSDLWNAGVVGEHCMGLEAGGKPTVESTQERMQT